MYERADSVKIVISTFNLDVELDDANNTDRAIGLWLKPQPSKQKEAVYFQSALSTAAGAATASGLVECRLDVHMGDTFDAMSEAFDLNASESRLTLILRRRTPSLPLGVQLKRVGGD